MPESLKASPRRAGPQLQHLNSSSVRTAPLTRELPCSQSWSCTARETNLDVATPMLAFADGVAGELDHSPGEFRDSHRTAHIEHKHVAPKPIGPAWMTSCATSELVMK